MKKNHIFDYHVGTVWLGGRKIESQEIESRDQNFFQKKWSDQMYLRFFL
jgi:hypothetical protein